MTRAATRAWRIALLLGAAVQPWCEAGALEHARARLAERDELRFVDWDLDVSGLRLDDVEVDVRGRGLAIDTVTIGLADGVVDVELVGLAERPVAAKAVAPAPASEPAAEPATPARSGPRVPDTRGLAVRVRARDDLVLALPTGAELVLAGAAMELDGEGGLAIVADARVDRLDVPRVGAVSVHVPDLLLRREPLGWYGRGTAAIDAAPPIAFELARADTGSTTVGLTDDRGGTLEVAAEDTRLSVRAEGFGLAGLGRALLDRAAARGLELRGARLGGALEVTRADALVLHADGVVLDGVALDDRRLAAVPVRLDALLVDGDATIHGLDRFEAQLVVDHRGAQVAVVAARDGDALRVGLELAELECAQLLAALPSGTADLLQGARLSGRIDGRAELAVSLAELARARARGEREADEPPPGVLALDFDVLERCRTVAAPASVDLQGLRGPWRHRFVGTDGRVQERVLATGAPGFAPLGRVSKIAEAFIALEDMRFWYHDGFDREQIERAFWHNLEHGRVRRGASTISQQTARNLWLGVDRSLARKLQEAYLTALLEAGVSKTRILELYVNLVELAPGVYGVDAAAQHYFGKPATELAPLQAIHLAALAPAPRTFSERFASGEVDDTWLADLRDHARRMHRNHMLTAGELWSALHDDLDLLPRR